MMKRIRVNFSETTKEVKADTTLEMEAEDLNTTNVLQEAKELFNEAQTHAKNLTLKKLN